MTGYGDAHLHAEGVSVSVEIRSVNNRYFKLTVRGNELFSGLESQIESLTRKHINRGTVTVNLRVKSDATADKYRIDTDVLQSYVKQIREMSGQIGIAETPHLDSVLLLPGVVQENTDNDDEQFNAWPVIEKTLKVALEKFDAMRQHEGETTTHDLRENLGIIAKHLQEIEVQSPNVVAGYRDRMTERVNKVLEEFDVSVDPSTLLREVAIFTDRVNISEEVVRLKSHLQQFEMFLEQKESAGRKLDFLTQELFRETNTIGSKANDAEIAKGVVEMKTAIEKIREQVQNIE
ncbi:YicC family protein [Blastopirellula marina]|uniref:YicC family protein n=2 Tax=Blastopirellula marina TaxID=124 RepID=A0A2S8GDN4_9BACT|nr:YicC family protein [Blastopirellula marina]